MPPTQPRFPFRLGTDFSILFIIYLLRRLNIGDVQQPTIGLENETRTGALVPLEHVSTHKNLVRRRAREMFYIWVFEQQIFNRKVN